ncbi:MAG: AfsA-related hotdog domain-containing protein [Deltaproteobacteria bacterium]
MTERIDGRYVHKIIERNVLLARVERRPGKEEWYDAEMVQDVAHPFFFEHTLDHIPAMMLVEAGRQLGIAISHLFLGVPMGHLFATRAFDIGFTDFAELDIPVTISAAVTDKRYRHGELFQLRLDGYFSQAGRRLGTMGGDWAMLPPALWRRYRRREQARIGA